MSEEMSNGLDNEKNHAIMALVAAFRIYLSCALKLCTSAKKKASVFSVSQPKSFAKRFITAAYMALKDEFELEERRFMADVKPLLESEVLYATSNHGVRPMLRIAFDLPEEILKEIRRPESQKVGGRDTFDIGRLFNMNHLELMFGGATSVRFNGLIEDAINAKMLPAELYQSDHYDIQKAMAQGLYLIQLLSECRYDVIGGTSIFTMNLDTIEGLMSDADSSKVCDLYVFGNIKADLGSIFNQTYSGGDLSIYRHGESTITHLKGGSPSSQDLIMGILDFRYLKGKSGNSYVTVVGSDLKERFVHWISENHIGAIYPGDLSNSAIISLCETGKVTGGTDVSKMLEQVKTATEKSRTSKALSKAIIRYYEDSMRM